MLSEGSDLGPATLRAQVRGSPTLGSEASSFAPDARWSASAERQEGPRNLIRSGALLPAPTDSLTAALGQPPGAGFNRRTATRHDGIPARLALLSFSTPLEVGTEVIATSKLVHSAKRYHC